MEKRTAEQIDERLDEISSLLNEEGADVKALGEEVRSLKEEKESLIEDAKAKDEVRKAVANGKGIVIRKVAEMEDNKIEVRNSKEYIEAFANAIKTQDAKFTECRSLLSANTTGGIMPVPDILANKIQTAWDNNTLMNEVTKTNLKGNVRVGFEIEGDDAVIHVEGTDAPAEENLTLGVVTIIPQSIKKWITVSDEAMDLDAVSFVEYLYSELAYKIVKKATDMIIEMLISAPEESTATATGQAKLEVDDFTATTIAEAVSLLSDEATNPIIVMNKANYAVFKGVQSELNYAQDVFDGLKVVFNNKLTNDQIIVGDFKGVQCNFPSGNTIDVKYDDLSMAEKDLVKIVGRQFIGMGVVAPFRFTRVIKG